MRIVIAKCKIFVWDRAPTLVLGTGRHPHSDCRKQRMCVKIHVQSTLYDIANTSMSRVGHSLKVSENISLVSDLQGNRRYYNLLICTSGILGTLRADSSIPTTTHDLARPGPRPGELDKQHQRDSQHKDIHDEGS